MIQVVPLLLWSWFAQSAAHRALLTVDAVNAAVLEALLAFKAAGPGVLRVEILLDRAKFSPGEMNGVFGHNLSHTVPISSRYSCSMN